MTSAQTLYLGKVGVIVTVSGKECNADRFRRSANFSPLDSNETSRYNSLSCHNNEVEIELMRNEGYSKRGWLFVGECGLDVRGEYLTDEDEYIFWLELGVKFLRHTFEPPPDDGIIDVLWASSPHGQGKFPVIAIGFDGENTQEMQAYVKRLEEGLGIFDKAVNWRKIKRSAVIEQTN
jgi:hypothetical protein